MNSLLWEIISIWCLIGNYLKLVFNQINVGQDRSNELSMNLLIPPATVSLQELGFGVNLQFEAF